MTLLMGWWSMWMKTGCQQGGVDRQTAMCRTTERFAWKTEGPEVLVRLVGFESVLTEWLAGLLMLDIHEFLPMLYLILLMRKISSLSLSSVPKLATQAQILWNR